jgi:hypothetical protein
MNSSAYTRLLAAAAVCAALTGPALAEDSTYTKHCAWQPGKHSWDARVYVCNERTDSASSSSTTTCNLGPAGVHDTDCKTHTESKEPPPPAESSKEVTSFDATAMERARAREEENKKKGRTGVVACTTDHWVKDHWEPTCR